MAQRSLPARVSCFAALARLMSDVRQRSSLTLTGNVNRPSLCLAPHQVRSGLLPVLYGTAGRTTSAAVRHACLGLMAGLANRVSGGFRCDLPPARRLATSSHLGGGGRVGCRSEFSNMAYR